MKNIRVTIILFVSVFFLSTCDSGDDYWDGTIYPVRCPSSEPCVVNSLVASTCYKTKEDCLATGPGRDYGCIKCDY